MPRHYQFEIAESGQGKDIEWNWVLTAPNGKKVAQNVHPFTRKNDLTKTLAVIRQNFNDAEVFEVRQLM